MGDWVGMGSGRLGGKPGLEAPLAKVLYQRWAGGQAWATGLVGLAGPSWAGVGRVRLHWPKSCTLLHKGLKSCRVWLNEPKPCEVARRTYGLGRARLQ